MFERLCKVYVETIVLRKWAFRIGGCIIFKVSESGIWPNIMWEIVLKTMLRFGLRFYWFWIDLGGHFGFKIDPKTMSESISKFDWIWDGSGKLIRHSSEGQALPRDTILWYPKQRIPRICGFLRIRTEDQMSLLGSEDRKGGSEWESEVPRTGTEDWRDPYLFSDTPLGLWPGEF